ncbi:copper resistance protein CopC [Micromonospora sp. DT48]|uniref:copper resistance CopC family protein n=1 Tax=unclassified Micromonospora TaxID=2617518 RepID=UPI0012BB7470|nr:copper resistance CopC family protein [Micromonospora sp. CP22]MTK02400.1 copper resistance protein CopC [Micromonospora sp. CP22]
MRHHPRGPARVAAALLALVLAAGVVVLGAATPASAHGTLAMSTPADGAKVGEPLTAVRLYFTERVRDDAYFTVTAPGGGRVDTGWTHGEPRELDRPVREYFLVDGVFEPHEYTTGFPAVVTLAHLPATGRYTVSYLSVASDGDPVRGSVTFRYTGKPTAAPPNWRPPTGQPDPALLAAAEQHGNSEPQAAPGTSADPSPVTPATPEPTAEAAAPISDDPDNGGLLGWVVVAVAVVAGLLWWRLQPARVQPNRKATRRTGAARPRGTPASATKKRRTPAPGGDKRRTVAATARRGTRTAPAVEPVQRPAAAAPASATGVADRPATTNDPATTPDGATPRRRPQLGDTRTALLVGGLVVALVAGFALGRIGAADSPTAAPSGTAPGDGGRDTAPAVAVGDGHQHAPGTGPHTHPGDAQDQATGTTVSVAGYTLKPVLRSQPAGATTDYRFRIVGVDGQPVTGFAVVHGKPLHLIVVGRDLGGYQHLHPTMAADGTWSVPLTLARPGGYRIYADFTVTTGDSRELPLVLGVDHEVPGSYQPAGLPPAQPQASVGPYTVSMAGTPTIGMMVPVTFRVARDGVTEPVRLERYLGAYGHLVVVREGDLGYLHVHPEPELVDGGIAFWLTAPSTGRYRAFLDFQVDGAVHTAAFTINLP